MNFSLNNHDSIDILDYAYTRNFGELHIKVDPQTQLRAIIAIHSVARGPAIGGCRFLPYPNSQTAIYDALRLAKAMSYKAAMADLNFGGGKAVLIQPQQNFNRHAYFAKFADFIETLDGRFITAEDSGTSMRDMDTIATRTSHVAGVSAYNGDPSPYTAAGIIKGIEAAVQFKLGKNSLDNIHVAIQGVGHVGFHLAQQLFAKGAKLSIADPKISTLERCESNFNAQVVACDMIHKTDCDVFAPCALGATINEQTIPEIKAPIIAGAANNQLAQANLGEKLYQRGILYAPDYVVNAGGLIYIAGKYDKAANEHSLQKIDNIRQVLFSLFDRAQKEQKPPNQIADIMAEEKLKGDLT